MLSGQSRWQWGLSWEWGDRLGLSRHPHLTEWVLQALPCLWALNGDEHLSIPLGLEWDTVKRWKTWKENLSLDFGVYSVMPKISPSRLPHKQFMLRAGEIVSVGHTHSSRTQTSPDAKMGPLATYISVSASWNLAAKFEDQWFRGGVGKVQLKNLMPSSCDSLEPWGDGSERWNCQHMKAPGSSWRIS